MILLLVTALIAVCGADKLDRSYLPPASANTAGGSPGSLQTPFKSFNQGLGGLPKGSYNNEFEGVVVDASAPGTRASGADDTGLGGPRIAYGSLDSKVGAAAFTADTAFPRVGLNSGVNTQGFGANPQSAGAFPERIQSSRDRASNTVKYENEVSPDKFNYAFETDNGIVAEENGIEVDGVKAQGGYSYTGDDGQVYSVTYTADEDGYRPKGDHLPTPPPIPAEILESLEKNAQDEAAGIVDDGSYNAQKYNTGEDFTKSDNGQYNKGQPTQLGNRPQFDAVASGSFINQNNQGFVRPSSQQFVSTFSQDSSKNVPSNVNNFGSASGADKPVQNQQTFGLGVSSQNEYLPPTNGFNSNRRPALNGSQRGVQNPTYNSNGFNKNQNTETPAFIPLSQQKLQEDGPKRPQSSSPIFGKPAVIDSTLSIKDPFAKRPSTNRFTQNKQPNQSPQAIGGSFEVVSGNVYSSKNEYLPPRHQGNKFNQNQRYQGPNSGTQTSQQFINSQPFNSNSPSASAFASASRPSLQLQSSQQDKSQQIPQSFTTNPTASNLFSQVGPNYNVRPSNEKQPQFSSSQTNIPNFNGSPVTQFQYRPSTFPSQPPTLQPQIELSTPVVSNSNENKNIAPVPVIDGPESPSQPGSTGVPLFGTQPTNTFQSQFGFNSNKIQQASPTQPSFSAVSTPSDSSIGTGSQTGFPSGRPLGNLGSQSQPTKSPGNEQYSFSTQRPNFNQYNQQQGADDSYYYNSPSKPFNTPTPRPQSSIFPSTSFGQSFKVTQTPFGSKPQLPGTSTTFFSSQTNTPTDNSRYPNPSTTGSIFPTQPTQQDNQNGNTFQTQFNRVTQASSSSFPSPIPTTAAGVNSNQFNARPTQPVNNNQGSQSFNQQQSSAQPQKQYGGEVYEYNKPPQTLPTPQNGASSGQFGHTSQLGSSSNAPISQSPTSGTYTPGSQFGSKFTQQPFGQRPQNSQGSQDNQAFNINNQGQPQQKPGQFGSQRNPSQNSQAVQGASQFPPTYNQEAPPCCKQLGPSQTSQADDKGETPQFSNQFRPNQDFSQQGLDQGANPTQSVSTFAGVGESFGGPRKPPSFDNTGYHY